MSSTVNLFRPGALRWMPDASAINAPDGTLLRAQNLVPDQAGSLSLRRGSSQLYTNLGTSVNSLYTAELQDGTTYRAAGVDDTIAINGVTQASSIAGSGDLAAGDDSRQMFFARSTSKKKWDGTTMNNWSIAAPSDKVTLAAVASITSSVATFDADESPLVTVQEGTGTVGGSADQSGISADATDLTPKKATSRGVLQKLWTSNQDFFNISGVDGTETDLIDLYLKFDNVRNVDKVKLVFGCDNSSTIPFKDDRFEFTFNLGDDIPIQLKDPVSEGYAAYNDAVDRSVSGVLPADVTGIQSPFAVKKTITKVGKTPSPKSNAPGDDVWSHLTITRGQFERIGNTATRGWTTIRGFKVILFAKKSKTVTMTISDATVIGGGDRALSGTFKCVLVGVRTVKDTAGKIVYYEKSPAGPQSDSINLNHQTLQITISGSMITGQDSQIDQYWVYLYGGWLDSYYRFAVIPAQVSQGMSIDELVNPAGSDFDTVPERMRIPSWGFTYSQLNSGGVPSITASTDLVLTLRTSEMDALVGNERLAPYQIPIPDNVIDIAGPWKNRQFVLTSEGYVYPTVKTAPSTINSLQVVDLTRYGDSLWIAKTGNGIVIGMERDIIVLTGTGEEAEDGARIDLRAQPLNVGNPPIDSCHWVEGNSVIYRSADGLMELTGNSLNPVPPAGTSLLWRGQDRHGIEALNVATGRFRMAMDNGMLYMLAPEGSSNTVSNVIYRYSYPDQQWSRFVFNQISASTGILSIFNNPDGSLLIGDGAGVVWTLEDGTQDNTNNITIDIETPVMDGQQPLLYKDPFDIQLHCNTGGGNVLLHLRKDEIESDNAPTYTVNSSTFGIWRANISNLGKFVKAQLLIDGSAPDFSLSKLNMTYRARPQRMMYFDTGYITPPGSGDLVWPQEIEADLLSDSTTVTMELYLNDVIEYTTTINPTAGIRDVYQIPLPFGTKGERPRVVFYVDDDSVTGDVGFDPYMVRLRLTGSGNEDMSRKYLPMYPLGMAS
jgi:hypothetical protein